MQNDDNEPIPFEFSPLPPAQPLEEVKKKKPRGRPRGSTRKPSAPVSTLYTPTEPLKLDLRTALEISQGLDRDDVKFITGVVEAMAPFDAAQRRRILAALGKIFT